MAYEYGGGALAEFSGSGAPGGGTDEVQTLTFGGTPTGGNFRLGFEGFATALIAWSNVNATLLAAINSALAALPTVGGAGQIVATAGTLTAGIGTVLLTFSGSRFAKKDVALITVVQNALTGTSPTLANVTTTPGVDSTQRDAAIGAKYTDTANGKFYVKTAAHTWAVVGSQT